MTTWNHSLIVLMAFGLFWEAPPAHAQARPAASAMSLEEHAKKGDAAAQVRLGMTLINGGGGTKDVASGLVLIRKAAEKAHPPALRLLGDLFSAGKLVRKDDDLAVHLYRAAAERGDADAQAELGMRYMLGQGVATDRDAALGWHLRAAAGGSAKATCILVYSVVLDPAADRVSAACDTRRTEALKAHSSGAR